MDENNHLTIIQTQEEEHATSAPRLSIPKAVPMIGVSLNILRN